MLFGTDDFWESVGDIIKDICFLSVGIKKTSGQKFDISFYLFSYRTEVVIEDIIRTCRICNGFVVKLI